MNPVGFESGAGRPSFEIRPAGDEIGVFDGSGHPLASVSRGEAGFLVRDADGGESGRVVRHVADGDEELEWRMPDGTLAFVLEREADGDLELEDGAGITLFEIKRRDYGFKVVDSKGADVLRVRRAESGKISIRDQDDLTYLTTRDEMPIEVAAVWSLPGLDFVSASGFALALWLGAGDRP